MSSNDNQDPKRRESPAPEEEELLAEEETLEGESDPEDESDLEDGDEEDLEDEEGLDGGEEDSGDFGGDSPDTWTPHDNLDSSGADSLSPTRLALRRLFANRLALLGLVYIVALCLAAVFGPMVWKHDHVTQMPREEIRRVAMLPQEEQAGLLPPFAPSREHPFGTDSLGRDLLAKTFMGARVSLAVGFMASFIAVAIGVIYGGVAGFAGGRTGRVMMRAVDIIYAVPLLLIVIFLIIVFEGSPVERPSLRIEFDAQALLAAHARGEESASAILVEDGGLRVGAFFPDGLPEGKTFALSVLSLPRIYEKQAAAIEGKSENGFLSATFSPRPLKSGSIALAVKEAPGNGTIEFAGVRKPSGGSVDPEEHIFHYAAGAAGPGPDSLVLEARAQTTGAAWFFGLLLGALKAWIYANPATARIKIIFIAMGVTYWLPMARVVRAKVLSLKEMDYALAARAAGASRSRILFKHLLPNSIGPIIVMLTLSIPEAIFAEAFLSYIGLGIEVPMASWGTLASEGVKHIKNAGEGHLLLFPALAISFTMLAFNFLGDGLRDAFDPQMTNV